MFELDSLSPVQKEQNLFRYTKQPETLAISLISSRGQMRGKEIISYAVNYIQ